MASLPDANVAPIQPLSTAIALVKDGDRIAISKLNPAGALLALVAAGRRNLHVIGVPTAGYGADILAAAGAMARIEAGALVIGNHGTAQNVQRGIEAGEIVLIDSSCPLLELQVQAGAMGIGFIEVPGFAGSDLLRRRPDLKIMPDPFDADHDVIVARALRPDVAIIHGLRADANGNVVVSIRNEDRLLARAAHRVIATVEQISDDALDRLDPEEEVIPAMVLDAVCELPGGARPFACPGAYDEDVVAVRAWMAAARSQDTMRAHLATVLKEARNA